MRFLTRPAPIASRIRARPGPGELIRIRALLDAEEQDSGAAGHDARRERDRAIGRRLEALAQRPVAQLLAWSEARGGDAPGDAGAMRLVGGACAALGALLGAATAAGAFWYDGSGRVNVLLLLALFVALPLLTLALFAAAAVSKRGLRGISAGRLGALVARGLPAGGARALAGLAAGDHGAGPAKWLLLCWSQWLGLGFGAGALAGAVTLVLFTDLAFGWATTLDVDAAAVQRLAEALAAPWRGLAPAAVPDTALVEGTRHFRIAGGAAPADPTLPGRWWSFVVMAMLVYGVLPRLLTLLFAQRRLSQACARALLADPRSHELLDRMNTPLVETRAIEDESHLPPAPPPAAWAELPAADGWQVVSWAGLALEAAALRSLLGGARLADLHAAGGARPSSEDRALARTLGEGAGSGGILVMARAHEPPTLELMDFVADLRAAAPARAPVALLPLALADGAPAPPSQRHAAAWRQAVARSAAGNVRLVRLREETRA